MFNDVKQSLEGGLKLQVTVHMELNSHMRVFGLPKDEVADRECWLQM